jgi:hypothetical protein
VVLGCGVVLHASRQFADALFIAVAAHSGAELAAWVHGGLWGCVCLTHVESVWREESAAAFGNRL